MWMVEFLAQLIFSSLVFFVFLLYLCRLVTHVPHCCANKILYLDLDLSMKRKKKVSKTGTKYYIPQIMWDVITCPCPCYQFLAHRSSYDHKVKPKSRLGVYITCHIFEINTLRIYSLSEQTSYHKISWSLEPARFGFILYKSIWDLTDTSATALLSNFIMISNLATSRLYEIWR